MKPAHAAAAVCVMAAWGFNFVVIKAGLQDFPPLLFNALRFLFVAVPAVFFIKFPKHVWKPLVAVGLILGALKFSLLFTGMNAGVGAGLASLLLQVQVFFTVALAAALHGEKINRMRGAGLFLGAAGLVVIGAQAGGNITAAGFLWITAAALAWAVANMFLRELKQVNFFQFIIWMGAVPVLPLLAVSFAYEGADNIIRAISGFSWTGAAALLYISLVSTVWGFAVWGRLLSLYSAAAAAPFALLVPVAGIFSGWLFLDEYISAGEWAGAFCIFSGLAFCIFGGRKPARKS